MDWSPFVTCPPDERPPRTRGITTPEGLGDRLRTAAFAEFQAREAFRRAAERFVEAPEPLRDAWRRLAAEEGKHYGWLLARMKSLGVEPGARPVSDALFRALGKAADAAEFARLMADAEDRGRAAERSFQKALQARDPETAGIFARIAEEEDEHIAIQLGYAGSLPSGWAARVKRHGGALKLFGVLLAALTAGLLVPWQQLAERRRLDGAIAPLIERARAAAIDYETAFSGREELSRGAVVQWCVEHPAKGVSYADGSPQKKIYWVDESPVPISRMHKGRCLPMVATVSGRRADGVVLEYLGILPGAQQP
mgnify:CR=1 FL=1